MLKASQNQTQLADEIIDYWLTQTDQTSTISVHTDEKTKLIKIFTLSDFVSRIAAQFKEEFSLRFFDLITENGIDDPNYDQSRLSFDQRCKYLLENSESESELFNNIRIFRQIEMSMIACADLLALHDIESSMLKVSDLADTIIIHTYQWLYKHLTRRYGEVLGCDGNKQHLQIMAMGKLGGRELNFSSDIDLIFAYPMVGETEHPRKPTEYQVFFTKLAQKLIAALDQINQYGRAYRVDMRLRPLGDSGPLVMPFSAFENYYQEQGREWERFAMQKMRIINDELEENKEYSADLYAIVKPFVYRKYLDFTTVDSIREMKTLIENEVRRKQITYNIKLGKGGIREIEFFVQSLQLIHAGRHTQCQQKPLLKSLQALTAEAFITCETQNQLKVHYLRLREIEQYLQIFNDAQTQTLPDNATDQARLSELMGHASYNACIQEIDEIMHSVHQFFRLVIDNPNHEEDTESQANTVCKELWSLRLSEAEQSTLLKDVFPEAVDPALFTELNTFREKVKKTPISEKGRRSLDKLMPLILTELLEYTGNSFSPRVSGCFKILSTILGRTTYIDLLEETPAVRERLLLLCEKSTWVASQIANFPILLDELLHPSYLIPENLPLEAFKTKCKAELREFLLRVPEDDEEAQMDALRQFKHTQQLRIAAADISGTLAITKVSDHLSMLAEVLLDEVVAQAWRQISHKFGRPNNLYSPGNFAIVGYGKFGGYELSYGSDLDIVCIYDAVRDKTTDGSGTRKPITIQEFYVKLVQRISHLCITQTYQGILYEIDLRLRPAGNSGLLISHIDSFSDYQHSDAWTWEHQALVRSRLVYGSEDLNSAFNAIKRKILTQERNASDLANDILTMRNKMRSHLDKSTEDNIDIKQALGGIVDIEFGVQFLVLLNASKFPQLAKWSDNLRLLDEIQNTELLSEKACNDLREAFLGLRHLGHHMQLAEKSLHEPTQELSFLMQKVIVSSPVFNLDTLIN